MAAAAPGTVPPAEAFDLTAWLTLVDPRLVPLEAQFRSNCFESAADLRSFTRQDGLDMKLPVRLITAVLQATSRL